MKFPMAVAQKARAARETGQMEIIGDGRQVRTYMYIKDAIDRLMAVGQSETDPGFLNIGGVTPYSCDEVADKAGVAAYAVMDSSFVTLTDRPGSSIEPVT